jgi:hypothetical protein
MQSVTEVYGVFLARNPTFNPQYPLFQNIMQALLVGPYLLCLYLTGGLGRPYPLYPFGLTDPVSALRMATLLARLVSLLMGAGVVTIAFETAKVLWNRTTGLIAGVLVLTIYPMFYYSRTSNVDMGALFWTALGLLVFAYCLRDRLTVNRAAWLGVFAGLATGTKDASWPAFLMIGAVVARQHLRESTLTAFRDKYRPLWVGAATASAVYVTASGFIFRPSRFFLHLRWITGWGLPTLYRLPPTPSGYARLMVDTAITLIDAFGAPMAICVIAGIIVAAWRDRNTLKWILPGVGIVLFVLVPARFVLLRYVLVVAYVLAFFAAFLFNQALTVPRLRRVAPLLLLLVVGWSLTRGTDLTYQMLRDPRYEVAAWLHQNTRPGDRVLYYANSGNLPPLDLEVRSVRANWGPGPPYVYKRDQRDPEFVILVPVTQYVSEPVHEGDMPEQDYQGLLNGSLGYRQVFSLQTSRLFSRRPLPSVNPHVQLFVRNDLLASKRVAQPGPQ